MSGKTILVTGGAGFIGTNFVHHILSTRPEWHIVNLDALTYAGNLGNFSDLSGETARRHEFVRGDIGDPILLERLFSSREFDGLIHFAAESHVDRSILRPEAFVETNVMGTFRLLEAGLAHWEGRGRPDDFRFLHISTDEVYGSLGRQGYFTEETAYDPSSPYSASKASSDHFVRSFFRTYGLPTLITNCSNNFGPYQFPEKLIPLMIINILEKRPLPVYGEGENRRDWLYVADHCRALTMVFEKGRPGQTYNIGGGTERRNIDIVYLLCDLLDARLGRAAGESSKKQVRFVPDRPGHDWRYAIDASKIRRELGWQPEHSFEEALEATIDWYVDHMEWIDAVRTGEYRKWIKENYQDRS
ncbi:MAG: dTDP-glucose 4,6-dehydratase [Thermodesulfobacteriota bacterium]|nr:dTDP-glucose 4,6-dehydratase [Thermodesulfobacteriota bacterium]